MQPRRRARGVALECLYEIDCANHQADAVLTLRLENAELSPGAAKFATNLVMGVVGHLQAMDRLIAKYAPEWPVNQMAIIDRNVLRIAIYELAVDGNTPVKVAINEAVELAKLYGADSSPRFVNGVLGSLVSHIDAIREKLQSR